MLEQRLPGRVREVTPCNSQEEKPMCRVNRSPSIAIFKVEINGSARAFRRNRTEHNQQGNGEWLRTDALESKRSGCIQLCHLDVHLLFSKHAQTMLCSEPSTHTGPFNSHSNLTRWELLLFIPFTDEPQTGYNLLNSLKGPKPWISLSISLFPSSPRKVGV